MSEDTLYCVTADPNLRCGRLARALAGKFLNGGKLLTRTKFFIYQRVQSELD